MNALIVNLSVADLLNCLVPSALLAAAALGHAAAGTRAPAAVCHTLDSMHVLGETHVTLLLGITSSIEENLPTSEGYSGYSQQNSIF